MKSSSFTAALISLTAAPVLAGTSTAVAPITPAPEETSWQVRTAMYGWAQGLEGDIGGFGVSSEFTWQAMAALGYRTSENSSLLLGYRAIGTDYTNDGFTYDIVAHGVALGFEYTF